MQATRAEDGSYALVYVPTNRSVAVCLTSLSGDAIRASWYDPRTGTVSEIGLLPKAREVTFHPPTIGPDWVLVLNDAAREFPHGNGGSTTDYVVEGLKKTLLEP